MKGMELSRSYYERFGAPMIHERFPEYEEIIAAGLTGSGSECYGYDDDVSTDHDFEPGFCLFIPGEDIVDRKTAFQLERAYAGLPMEFEGFRRAVLSPVGGNRHGVIRIDDFFRQKTGTAPEELSLLQWLSIPESALAEAVNGEIFRDDAGLMTDPRNILKNMPADVKLKRLAGHLLMMAQSGQYNYHRCLMRNETGAAQICLYLYTQHMMAVWFLLHNRYMPYYKWSFRALRDLPDGEKTAQELEELICSGNDPARAERKELLIEALAGKIISVLQGQGLTDAVCGDLEKHAYSVNDRIRDAGIRNLHILYAME